MSLKYTVLNVSYEQPDKYKALEIKSRRNITRYSDYTRKNKFNLLKKDQDPNNQQPYANQTKKYSLYQQYKKREYLKKMKISDVMPFESPQNDVVSKGAVKFQLQIDKRNQSTADQFGFSTLHSQTKPQIPNMRRKFSVSLNSSQPTKHYDEQRVRGIGIMGVRTSFLDKYKLKNQQGMDESLQDDQKDKRVKRRQILCSTKRNRSLQPRSLRTSEMKRNNYRIGSNFQMFSNDRIVCRPWSPTKEEEFQKL